MEDIVAEPVASLKQRDFINFMDLSAAEVEGLIRLALSMKRGQNTQRYLQDKNLGLLFGSASTRTRISFQVAARQLGGYAEHYDSAQLQLKNNESVKDTASVISRFLDAVIIRMYDMNNYGSGRAFLQEMAEYANIPIINALDDKDHPCQVLADLVTLNELYGQNYKKKTFVMAWGYSKRQKSPGVPHSMLAAAAILGMNVRYAYPRGFTLDEEYVAFAEGLMKQTGGTLQHTHDLREASEGADVIYLKNWKSLSMSTEEDARQRELVKDDWCLGSEHMALANPGAYYMDCMPFIRGEQVTAEVADGPQSIIYDQAENRLHAQKAILASLL